VSHPEPISVLTQAHKALDPFSYQYVSQPMSYTISEAAPRFDMISKGLLAVAAIGWSLFAYSAIGSGPDEQAVQDEIVGLRQKVTSANAERDKAIRERDQTIQTSGELKHLQKEIASATQELKRFEVMRARVSQAIDKTHPQLVTLASRSGTAIETATASSTLSAPLSKQQIRAAQEALVDLGYGKLDADGVFGPGTGKAVEAFERAKGLPLTGKLGPATLQALRTQVASVVQ
jgi:murein L,D-transpeptidase YcbB/YkuD